MSAACRFRLPIRVIQAYPDVWHVRDLALLNPNFSASSDLGEIEDADVIITDSWPDGADAAYVSRYQISASLLDRCKTDMIFLPCPPVAWGKEVAVDAMGHHSYQSKFAKAYLLHAQNALLEWAVA